MPNSQKIAVQFENPTKVYYVGQTVNGIVLINLTESTKMRGIRLNFSGTAVTRWRVSGQKTSQTRQESENYMNSEVTLFGNVSGSKADNPTMQPGSYQFPFSFLIPPSCPSSFEGTFGYIRYVCLATIDLPWKVDETFMTVFTVISLVDLNFVPNVGLPVADEEIKSLGACCCKSGNITCSLKIPRSGYVPGEIIPINMQIVNTSNVRVSEVDVCVEEHVEFHAEGFARNDVRLVARVKKGTIEPGKIQLWKNEGIRIPPVAPTLTNCRLININYCLSFNVDPSGVHTDLSFKIPLVIGNVPLRAVMLELSQNYGRFQPDGPSSQNEPLPPGMTQALAGSSYPDLPPPSHQEHIFGLANIENDDGRTAMQFAPRHAYYDWTQPTVVRPSF